MWMCGKCSRDHGSTEEQVFVLERVRKKIDESLESKKTENNTLVPRALTVASTIARGTGGLCSASLRARDFEHEERI